MNFIWFTPFLWVVNVDVQKIYNQFVKKATHPYIDSELSNWLLETPCKRKIFRAFGLDERGSSLIQVQTEKLRLAENVGISMRIYNNQT